VCVCVQVCVCVCACVSVYICVCVYTYVYTHTKHAIIDTLQNRTSLPSLPTRHTYIHIHTKVYVRSYTRMHTNAHTHTDRTHTHTHTYAADTQVANLKDCFNAPRQLIDLMRGPSLEVILEEVTRFQKFGTVSLPELLAVLEKVREPSSVNTMFFTTTTASRKKEVDLVVRKLRELVKHGD